MFDCVSFRRRRSQGMPYNVLTEVSQEQSIRAGFLPDKNNLLKGLKSMLFIISGNFLCPSHCSCQVPLPHLGLVVLQCSSKVTVRPFSL